MANKTVVMKGNTNRGMNYGTGTLDTEGDALIFRVSGMASATITFKGTFSGKISVNGQNKKYATFGGRVLFKSGVGSIGRNWVESDGTGLYEAEFRAVVGANYLTVSADELNSGSVDVSVSVTVNPSILFINGPVHNAEDEAIRDGRAYLASVPNLTAGQNERLDLTLYNPTNSGVNLFLRERLFGHNGDDILAYRAFAGVINPLSQSVNPINRRIGGAASSAEFKYQVVATGANLPGTVEGSGEPIHNTGVRERMVEVILPPGFGLGFSINGAGKNIASAVNLYATLQWFEQSAL